MTKVYLLGSSLAALAFSGQVVVAGAVGYGAYEVGHTAIEIRQAIAAGRLDAAASKLGALAGTVTGGAGASKLAAKVAAADAAAVAKVESIIVSETGSGGVNLINSVIRINRAGEKALRLTRADGSVIDISRQRVKEFIPNTHPNAPVGTLDKVKFENALPGSKGYKRLPTQDEIKLLEDVR